MEAGERIDPFITMPFFDTQDARDKKTTCPTFAVIRPRREPSVCQRHSLLALP